MATFRAALTQLSIMDIDGMRNNYDLAELPKRLFRRREDSLQTAAFSGSAKTIYHSATHLLLVADSQAGLGIRSHLPGLIDLIDSYTAAISADVTLGETLLTPARVSVEPGIYSYGERDYYGCAFRHNWLLEA